MTKRSLIWISQLRVRHLWLKAAWCLGDPLINYMWLPEVAATNISTGKKNKLQCYLRHLVFQLDCAQERKTQGPQDQKKWSCFTQHMWVKGVKHTWKSRSDKTVDLQKHPSAHPHPPTRPQNRISSSLSWFSVIAYCILVFSKTFLKADLHQIPR